MTSRWVFALAGICAAACSQVPAAQPSDTGQACSSAASCEMICVVNCDGGAAGVCDRPTAENCNRQCGLLPDGGVRDIPCA